jgi:hypothetical protein
MEVINELFFIIFFIVLETSKQQFDNDQDYLQSLLLPPAFIGKNI